MAAANINLLVSTGKDPNLSAWNQYYRPSCMSYSIESQSYITFFDKMFNLSFH